MEEQGNALVRNPRVEVDDVTAIETHQVGNDVQRVEESGIFALEDHRQADRDMCYVWVTP